MRPSRRAIAQVITSQIATAGVGTTWGLAAAHDLHWLRFLWLMVGLLAVLILIANALRSVASLFGQSPPRTAVLRIALAGYAAALFVADPFMDFADRPGVVLAELLLLPFLLALGPLRRDRAWAGLVSTASFCAAAIAILVYNSVPHGTCDAGLHRVT